MGIIDKLPEIYTDCKNSFDKRSPGRASFQMREIFDVKRLIDDKDAQGEGPGRSSEENRILRDPGDNLLVRGDNLDFMKYLLDEKGMKGKIQLIYADPPFYSKGKYEAVIGTGNEKIKIPAYDDKWTGGMDTYLKMICERLFYMKELTADTGYVCVHLDWHVVHYVKILADEVFGEENFVNEIIWTYKSGGSTKKRFARKHDTLLLYRISDKNFFEPQEEKSYNRGLKPYRFKDVEEFEDEKGWYTLVNMKDVWEIDMVGRTSSERTGYATQKPEALLKRLIKSCTRPGDLCADFFGGSGVMASAASDLDRKSVMCDIGKAATAFQRKRLIEKGVNYIYMEEGEEGGGEQETACSGDTGSPEHILIWSADTDYDGTVHRPVKVITGPGDKTGPETEILGGKGKNISLSITDIYGNIKKTIIK